MYTIYMYTLYNAFTNQQVLTAIQLHVRVQILAVIQYMPHYRKTSVLKSVGVYDNHASIHKDDYLKPIINCVD